MKGLLRRFPNQQHERFGCIWRIFDIVISQYGWRQHWDMWTLNPLRLLQSPSKHLFADTDTGNADSEQSEDCQSQPSLPGHSVWHLCVPDNGSEGTVLLSFAAGCLKLQDEPEDLTLYTKMWRHYQFKCLLHHHLSTTQIFTMKQQLLVSSFDFMERPTDRVYIFLRLQSHILEIAC